mgnify:CR=1 FL=1
MITDVIIMAGGFGERLWPASSHEHPKQFMALNNNVSFLQESIQRAFALGISGKIIIVTRKDIEDECTRQCAMFADKEKIVVLSEPYGRHTSAAIMTGVWFIKKQAPAQKHTVLVLTSDHVIGPTEVFSRDCATAAKAAEDGHFVCFAIPPTEPATGYGYIKAGRDIYGDQTVFAIDNFKEKPELGVAKVYIADGHYWWNSGMFAFDADMFLEEMRSCTPDVSDAFAGVQNGSAPQTKKRNDIAVLDTWEAMEATYKIVPSIAVDKAIAEKTKKAAAVKANFSWTDVGSWDTFSDLCTNPANKKVASVDSKHNFVYADIPVALCGVRDLIVVVKNGQLLIMKKGESALVRDAAKQMTDA